MSSLPLPQNIHQTFSELVRPAAVAVPELIGVDGQLAACLPYNGFRRGDTIVIAGSSTLMLLAIAHATHDGLWCGIVDLPELNFAAAHDVGVNLARIVTVPKADQHTPTVAATLLDVLDIVVLGRSPACDPTVLRKLSARARQRRKLLILADPSAATSWPSVALTLRTQRHTWRGIEDGVGYLTEHRLDVVVSGHGRATKPRRHTLVLAAS